MKCTILYMFGQNIQTEGRKLSFEQAITYLVSIIISLYSVTYELLLFSIKVTYYINFHLK